MPEWVPSTDFEDDSLTIEPELECDSTFENYENDLGASLFDQFEKNHMNKVIQEHYPEVNVDKKNKYNKCSSGFPVANRMIPQDLEDNDTTEYEILAMIRDYGMGPSDDENLNSSRTIAAISSARPYVIAGIPIMYDEDLFKLRPRKSNSRVPVCKYDKSSSSTNSHKVFNAEEKITPNISCAEFRQNSADAIKLNKIVSTHCHPKAMNRADKLTSKSTNKIPTQSPISQKICPMPELLVPKVDIKKLKSRNSISDNIPCATLAHPFDESNKTVSLTCFPKIMNITDRLTLKSRKYFQAETQISQTVYTISELVPSANCADDALKCKPAKFISMPSTSKNDKSSSTDCSLHKVANLKNETASNISCATHDSKHEFVVNPNKIAKARNSADNNTSKPRIQIAMKSPISHKVSTMSGGWVPSTDFEDDIIPQQLESDENFGETFLCPIKMNHVNKDKKDKNYKTPDFSEKLNIHKIANNNVSSRLPIRRRITCQDLNENNTTEYEILAMIRSQGMAPSVDENLNSTRTIPAILSDRRYTKSAIPILFDEDFFKLKPRQSSFSSNATSSKSKISSSTDCSSHRISKNVEESIPNTSNIVLGKNPAQVLEPREIDSLSYHHKAINGIDRLISIPEKKTSTQSRKSQFSLVHSTHFEDNKKELKPQDSISIASDSKYDNSYLTNYSSLEVTKDKEGSDLGRQNPISLLKANKIDPLSCLSKPMNDANRRTSTPHKSPLHFRGPNPATVVKLKEIDREPYPLEPLDVADRLSQKLIQVPILQKISTMHEWVPRKDFEDDIPTQFDCRDNCENYVNYFGETIFNAIATNHTNIGSIYETRDSYQEVNKDKIKCTNGTSRLPIERQITLSNLDENIAIEFEILAMIRQQGMTPSIDQNLSSARTIPAILSNRPYTKSVFPILYDESYFKLKPRVPISSASHSHSEMSSSTDCLSDKISTNDELTYHCQSLPEPMNSDSTRTEKLDKLSGANCSSHEHNNFEEKIGQNKSVEPNATTLAEPNKIDPLSRATKVENVPSKSARKIPIPSLTPRIYTISVEVVPDMNLCDISAILPECDAKCLNSLNNFTNRNVRRKLSIEQNCEIRDPYRKVNIIKKIKYKNGSSGTDKSNRRQMLHQNLGEIDTTKHKLLSMVRSKGMSTSVDENMNNNYGTDCPSHEVSRDEEESKLNMCMSCTALSPNHSSILKPSKIHLVPCFPKATNTHNWLMTRTRTITATDVNLAPAMFLTFFLSIFCCFLLSVLLNKL